MTNQKPDSEQIETLASTLPEIAGGTVSEDGKGNICLNDLWKLSSKPENKRPVDWRRSKRAQSLEGALRQRMVENLHHSGPNAEPITFYTVGRGQASRTFAHPVLALDYAEFLNSDLAIAVREVFLRYRSNDVNLALEILEGMSEQFEYDDLRVKLRQLVKDHNKLSAGAARAAGVTNFEAYNGAGLNGLYGRTKAQLLRYKGLPSDANHLDHAGHEELAANYFKATQAEAKLRREGIKGQAVANKAHHEVAVAVRETIKGLGGTMPEDEPALEHIKEAEKRLKVSQASGPKILPSKPTKK